MSKNKDFVIGICKNIKHTLNSLVNKKDKNTEISEYNNPMFNKPVAHENMLRRKLKKIMDTHNINKEDL